MLASSTTTPAQASKRSRAQLDLAGAELSGRPFIPSKGRWGFETSGAAMHGSQVSGNTQFISVDNTPEGRARRVARAAAM